MLEQAGMSKLLIPKLHSCTWKQGEALAIGNLVLSVNPMFTWNYLLMSSQIGLKVTNHFKNCIQHIPMYIGSWISFWGCTWTPQNHCLLTCWWRTSTSFDFEISPHQLTCQQVVSGIGSERLGKEWNVWWNDGPAAVLKMMRRRKRRRRHHDNQNDENYNHNS